MQARATMLAAAALVAGLIGFASHQAGALNGLERKTVDTRFAVRGSRSPDSRIAIVALDQRSYEAFGERPPISRTHFANLLDRLRAARPRLIAVDITFNGKQNPRADGALLRAIARDGPVLLGANDKVNGWRTVPAGHRHARGGIVASVGFGDDPDGIYRHMQYAQVILKTFAVRAAELVERRPLSESDFPGNQAWIDFSGPPGTYRSYSMSDVIDGRVPARALRGKTVLVGDTTPADKDIYPTAISSTPMPGVEIHANALATILAGFTLQSTGAFLAFLLIFGIASVPPLAAIRLPAVYVLIVSLAAGLLYLVGTQLAFNSGRIVPVLDPILALVLAAAGAISVDVLTEKRQREELEATLGRLPQEPSEFFISYRREQSAWPARILMTELAKRFGETSVFMDTDSIGAGQQWPRRIEQAIKESNVVLVLIGPGWLEAEKPDGGRRLDDPGDWVRLEIETALAAEGAVVVPVLLDGAAVPAERELPESLRPLSHRNAISLTADAWGAEIDALVESVKSGQIQEFLAGERSRASRPAAQ